MSQQRQPKGTETGGQFAASVNPESTVDLAPVKDETKRTQSDEYLEQLAEQAVETFDNWMEAGAEQSPDEDWNEWSHADAEEFFGQFERLIQIRKEHSAEMVAHAETQKHRPKGTETGGQFASDANPESTVLLDYDAITSRANAPGRLQGLTRCAYAVDEAIDTLTRWDGGSGTDQADVLAHLIEVREEIFAAADPVLVGQWRDLEKVVRDMEGEHMTDEDDYEVRRDEREALFQRIYEEAFAS